MLLKYEHLVLFPINPLRWSTIVRAFVLQAQRVILPMRRCWSTCWCAIEKGCAGCVRIQSRPVLFSSSWKDDGSSSMRRSGMAIV